MWSLLFDANVANAAAAGMCEMFYWRDRNRGVDLVVRMGKTLTTIEIQNSRSCESLPGKEAFANAFTPTRLLLIEETASHGENLSRPVGHWANALS